MKITTWNVNSIRARLERVVAWTRANEPDLLCIQETKVVDDDFPRADFEELGYTVAVHGQKTYNGVALLARGELENVTPGLPGDDTDRQARVIAATYQGVRVLNLYVPNGQEVGSEKFEYKLDWLDRLLDLLTKAHTPKDSLLLCGDFNIAPEDRDVYDPDRWRGKVLFSEPEKEMCQVDIDREERAGEKPSDHAPVTLVLD
jgi:exodeoxyribonuclease-3